MCSTRKRGANQELSDSAAAGIDQQMVLPLIQLTRMASVCLTLSSTNCGYLAHFGGGGQPQFGEAEMAGMRK